MKDMKIDCKNKKDGRKETVHGNFVAFQYGFVYTFFSFCVR